ncbi:hypothetical protein SSX86_003831 [Deinandra increscens subsp. villosa]|uniref:Roadblock/LAMTOR2 domain-containing protein n=1 Tax=Deinandra increscens subsp. villosa TaxID=3103831 RepID=A0AAP0H8F6_9ASTR
MQSDQLLHYIFVYWLFTSQTCLVGAGPEGKHTALEAVTLVLDLPPPQPGSMSGLTSINRVSASDPKSALALQRLVQAAVWFLGENANYVASEYAWESATPPGTALMMLDADKMVPAASSRNRTLVSALTRLQRCTFSGSWEVRITAAQALTTIAIRTQGFLVLFSGDTGEIRAEVGILEGQFIPFLNRLTA